MTAKPAIIPFWTDGDALKIQEPTEAKKLLGFTPSEKPSPFEFNWQLHYIGLWVEYLEFVTDSLKELNSLYDAIVGVNGSHATINDVMADMGVNLPAQDVSVFIIDPFTANTIQVIDKPGVSLVFNARASFSKGTATVGINIDAERCTIKNGTFQNFADAGNTAINMTANATKCIIVENRFFNNDTDINSDAGTNNVIANNITY